MQAVVSSDSRAVSSRDVQSGTMLTFDSVTLRHGEGFVLDRLTFALEPGRATALVGPSGCGKSTVLRLAAALLLPEAGRIAIGAQAVTPRNATELRQRLGYVLQEGGLFPHMTAAQNVTLMARYLGWSTERIAARVGELLELIHLTHDHLARYPSRLSGGERQRVSLARALMLDPALLLLDEPLGALDPIVRHDLQRELRQLFRQLRKTVLFVTHDVAEAGYLADDLILMRDGGIVQRGTLRELVEAPAGEFVTNFVAAQRQLADVLSDRA
jgi:osmoprotectant transport system ATP-binding protein